MKNWMHRCFGPWSPKDTQMGIAMGLMLVVLFAAMMAPAADKKISDYTLRSAASWSTSDMLPIVVSGGSTMKTTIADFDTRYFNESSVLAATQGGTGLSSYGAGGTILGMNLAGTALEYKLVSPGTGISITSSAGVLTVSNTGVTSVSAGTGLTGGPITSTGTLNVDVGITSGAIMQVGTGARAPAVDGYLLTGLNPANISGPVGPTKGGTGQSSFAIGTLLYASAANTWSVLPGGASGAVLTQGLPGGISVPQWIAAGTASYTAPTVQKFTSGSGTYTKPANVLYIHVEMIGGGGGGGGSYNDTFSNGGTGTAGGNTTFGTNTAAGGANNGGAGGAATLGTIQGIGLTGGHAATGECTSDPSSPSRLSTFGASGPLGGKDFQSGAATNSGGGGDGGYGNAYGSGGNNCSRGGGSAGAYISGIIPSPAATYSYAVGAGGSGGAAGTAATAGNAGAAGIIVVTEYYQ